MSAENGDLSAAELNWLAQCASGGFGMLITAATMVNESGRSWLGQPGLLNDKQLQQFEKIAETARQNEVLSLVQLHHGGIRAEQSLSGCKPVGPSTYLPDDFRPNGARSSAGSGSRRL